MGFRGEGRATGGSGRAVRGHSSSPWDGDSIAIAALGPSLLDPVAALREFNPPGTVARLPIICFREACPRPHAFEPHASLVPLAEPRALCFFPGLGVC